VSVAGRSPGPPERADGPRAAPVPGVPRAGPEVPRPRR